MTTAFAEGGSNMRLSVNPKKALIGDPINIIVENAQRDEIVKIRVSATDQSGNNWVSEASYRADSEGVVDTSKIAPVSGSYKGIDQAGLFWSMKPETENNLYSPFVVMPHRIVSLIKDGKVLETQTIEITAFVDLERYEVKEPIKGVLLKPKEINKPSPALIILSGSEGGIKEGWAAIVASKTRMPTLALAYFGVEGLPKTLENIPLETIGNAIKWLEGQPYVAKGRIGILGASRGGELAMLAATVFPQIKAVVGYTPSGAVWQGIGIKPSPAWTYQGKAFPYLRVISNEALDKVFFEAQQKGEPYYSREMYQFSLAEQKSAINGAVIQVEKSDAAFLLIGNPDDGVWPSYELSKITIDRLKAYNHKKRYELLSYRDGGHIFVVYPYYPTTIRKFYLPTIRVWEGLGGTAEGAAMAAKDSWEKVIEFLNRELNIEN